jgi:hypothetical protein
MKALKAGALCVVIAVGICLCDLIGHVRAAVDQLCSDESVIARGVVTSIARVNRPCEGSGQDKADNCGTLALAGQVMVNAGDLVKQSQGVERKESLVLDRDLPQLFAKANVGVDRFSSAAAELQPLLRETTARTAALAPIETNAASLLAHVDAGADPLLDKAALALDDLHQLTANPDIQLTLGNVRSMTASGAGILQDGKDEADKLAHPPKRKLGFWAGVLAGGDAARHFMPPIF